MTESLFRVIDAEDGASGEKPDCDDPRVDNFGSRSHSQSIPLSARIVLAGLGKLRAGCLVVNLPDGSNLRFGMHDGLHGELTVHRWRFFSRLLRGGDTGAGESYVDGDWSTPDLVALTRLFLINEDALAPPRLVGWLERMRDRLLHVTRSNTRTQARRNIGAHYDLSNHFYSLFLDPSMTYSAGLFTREDMGLEAAQKAKYTRLAEWAGLQKGDHVLEIGCGWGGFAEHAAGVLGCRVTAITLSAKQATFARDRMEEHGLSDLVRIRLLDYRDVTGSFDAVVSIEMLEAVGHRYLDRFFEVCDRVVKPGGRVALQTISIPDQEYDRYRRGSDWIRKYIFPGGHLPSLGAIQASLGRRTSLVVDRLDNIGESYAATLRQWRRRFWMKIDDIRDLGFDDDFVRLWDFYLATCEAAFLQHQIGNLQLRLSRAGESGRRSLPAGSRP